MGRTNEKPHGDDQDATEAQEDPRLAAEREKWEKSRTCSRVSGGECEDCQGETYFSHWRRKERDPKRTVLCSPCFEKRYDPAAAAKRKTDELANAEDRKRRSAFAREEVRRRAAGEPPVDGWRREGSLLVNDTTGERIGLFS